MKKPIAFNSTTQTQFGTKLGDYLEIGTSESDFGAGAASEALNWFNSLDPNTQYVIVSDTYRVNDANDTPYTDNTNQNGRPIMWCTGDKTTQNLLNTVNRLPGRRGEVPFTGATDAINWVNNSNVYYFLSGGLGKSYIAVVSVDGQGTYHHVVLDYDTNQATLIDTGISNNDYSQYDIMPVTDAGYMSIFESYYNSTKRILFISKSGEVIEDYTSLETTNWNEDPLDRGWSYFLDHQNGVFKFFDGINPSHEFTYDPNLNFNIEWWWDSSTSDNAFMFSTYDGNINEKKFYLVKPDGSVTLFRTVNQNNESVTYAVNIASDFIVEWVWSQIDNKYTTYTVYSSNGVLINTTDLTMLSDTYNDYNFEFFGLNKNYIMFMNNSDPNVQYYIIKYDGTISSYDIITHARGDNYISYSTESQSYYRPREYKRDMACITFYSNNSYDSDYLFNYYQYIDFMWFVSGTGQAYTYTFANNQQSGSYQYGTSPWNIDLGGGVFIKTNYQGALKILTLKDDGTTHYETIAADFSGSGIDSYYNAVFGDKYWFAPYQWNAMNSGNLHSLTNYAFSKDGVILDTYNFTGDNTNPVGYLNYDYDYNVLYVRMNNNLNNQAVYFNENNTFTTFPHINYVYNTNTNYLDRTYYTAGNLLLLDQNAQIFRMISKNGATLNDVLFPIDYNSGNGWSLYTGKDTFLFEYTKSGDNSVGCVLYDYLGNLLQTVTTTDTNNNNTVAVENRMGLETGNGSTYTFYLLAPTEQKSVGSGMVNSIYDRSANDVRAYWC